MQATRGQLLAAPDSLGKAEERECRPRAPAPATRLRRSEKDFFLLVKTAFNQRRKTLRNAVKSLFDATILEDELFNKRAEQLTVEQFAALTFKMR